jgi:branched-chain amino acid transport system permease protein
MSTPATPPTKRSQQLIQTYRMAKKSDRLIGLYTLLAFVIVITGGLGSMPGALVGGVLIGLTEAMAGLFFTPSAKSMFAFAILVLVLLFRPQGIMGKKFT